ncbi:putative glycoside hydrolase [Teredinibacter turnerae]|uniref:putative glycoside hydrolase n=1 Tax=Teredinibacter turnerae TaxID=2426 RepID=UPI0003697B56|nr:putative glycoside hydrolase [Teredinibacter turnerae]
MIRTTTKALWIAALSLASTWFAPATQAADSQQLNPDFFYYFNGQGVGYRGFSVSDPDNWGGVQAKDFAAVSKGKKVEMKPTDYKAKNDAIQVTWARKKTKGVVSLYGSDTDLSKYKDLTALAFDVKVDQKPSKDVQLGMDCGYPCRAEVSIARQLREFKKGEWSLFWMPLNCFKSDTFDLSKIKAPFMLSTEGKMELSIANIRLERLPKGFPGCNEE